jgi:hypothetical protein
VNLLVISYKYLLIGGGATTVDYHTSRKLLKLNLKIKETTKIRQQLKSGCYNLMI